MTRFKVFVHFRLVILLVDKWIVRRSYQQLSTVVDIGEGVGVGDNKTSFRIVV